MQLTAPIKLIDLTELDDFISDSKTDTTRPLIQLDRETTDHVPDLVSIESDSTLSACEDIPSARMRIIKRVRRRQKAKLYFRTVPSVVYRAFAYSKNNCVKLNNGRVLRINYLARSNHGQILIGDELVSTTGKPEWFPAEHNELFWNLSEQANIRLNHEEFSLRRRIVQEQLVVLRHGKRVDLRNQSIYSVNAILGPCQVVFTNRFYADCSAQRYSERIRAMNADAVHRDALYFCRWKHKTVHDRKGRAQHESLERLTTMESHNSAAIASCILRERWRGHTKLGGSHREHEKVTSSKKAAYTIGDAFCGGGGASQGAISAGLKVTFAFDHDGHAIATYKMNCEDQGTFIKQCSVEEFLEIAKRRDLMVDILHISPPCQPFSPNHTIPSVERDERNQAALLSVDLLVKYLKPRIVTLEETDGLLNRHIQWFNSIIRNLVEQNYSVRWGVLRLADYGVPQLRQRLIVVGAGPGETLPSFPRRTHSPTDGTLRKTRTIFDCINGIPSNSSHMNTASPCSPSRPPYNPHRLAKTVTTGGRDDYHWCGTRFFHLRELASLQTFSYDWKMVHWKDNITVLKRIIGNAFPPSFARAVFNSVAAQLTVNDEAELIAGATIEELVDEIQLE